MKSRFTLEKKMVAVVRYFETMYLIHDDAGERVYTGTNEVTAKRILQMLNRETGFVKRKKPLKRKTRK